MLKLLILILISFCLPHPTFSNPINLPKLHAWYDDMLIRIHTAGNQIRQLSNSGIRTVTKTKSDGTSKHSPVTIADVASDKLLRTTATHSEIFPVIDEESSSNPSDSIQFANQNTFTWIDPLDATKEFSQGLDEYVSVMACVTHYGTPVAGIIYFPFRNETWGARIIDSDKHWDLVHAPKDWKLPLLPALVRKVIVSRTKSHLRPKYSRENDNDNSNGKDNRNVKPDLNINVHLSNKIDQLYAGGAGYKVVEVLSSRVGAYAHTTLIKGWDVCAGDAMLRAAGGEMVDLNGKPLVYKPEDSSQRNGILAILHTDLVLRRHLLTIDGGTNEEDDQGDDGDEKEEATQKKTKKKKKVQLGPLLGMITFVAILRAILPKYWYSKDDSKSGKSSKSSVSIEPKIKTTKQNGSNTVLIKENTWKHLIFCAIGIQVCYLAWGTAQERLMSHSYNGEHFQYSSVLLLINKILSASLAVVLLTQAQYTQQGNGRMTLKDVLFQTAPPLLYSYAALANGISSWCQYEALKHTIFPVVVVFKASKMIPVMLIGSHSFFGKTYPTSDYIVAAIIAVGVTLALVGGSSYSSNSSGNSGSGGISGISGSGSEFKGLFLMLGYVCFDSFTSNWQSYIFKTYKSSSLHMMFAANSFSSLILGFTVSFLMLF